MTDADPIAEAKMSNGAEPEAGSAQSNGSVARAPAILVGIIVATIVGLSLWYLAQPQPVLIQGEADATRIDIAARIDGKVGKRPVERGENVAAGAVLFEIDNPELLTKSHEAQAALGVAHANLAHIQAGTRSEEIDQKKAAMDAAAANLVLSQRSFDRIKEPEDPQVEQVQPVGGHRSRQAHESGSEDGLGARRSQCHSIALNYHR